MLNKQPIGINFAQGLNTKLDPWQLPIGQFLSLVNSIFTIGGRLTKRYGYEELPDLPSIAQYLTTLNGNLTAIGSSILALNSGAGQWISKGSIAPLSLSTLPLIRNSIDQIQCDAVISSSGLVCTVYTEKNNGTSDYKYAIADSVTGQNIIQPTLIPAGTGLITGSPRVFLLGQYFVIVFTNEISTVFHLQYISINSENVSLITSAQNVASVYTPASTVAWDGVVSSSVNNLYIAYNTSSGGQAVKVTYLSISNVSTGGAPTTPHTFTGQTATMMSLCVDETNQTYPIIYISYYNSGSSTGFTAAVNSSLSPVFAPQEIIASGTVLNLASAAQNQVCTVFSEVSQVINAVTISGVSTTPTIGSPYVVIRSVGLASKAFIVAGDVYFLSSYASTYQNTYFLINGSTSTQGSPQVVAKLAYENGGGLLTLGLPSAVVNGSTAQFPYLYADFIAAESTVSATPVAGQILGVYSQTGINLASINFGGGIDTSEIAGNLHIAGGFLWAYDGYLPVEHNFFLYPDGVTASGSGTSGSMAPQEYFYTACYEWEDNQGNVYRSAPAIDVSVTLTSDTSVSVTVPYLRLTYKTANPAKIVIYRWSVAQQIFYRVTSLTIVQLNQTTSDTLTYVDSASDASIAGNDILYTNGGVVEDINAPATNIMTLFDTRLWLVDAEDQNLLWFSKQVIESTPVEMSDLFTFYVAPTTASEGSTGPITALAPMDDKLIIFKQNAIYYINGTGPDNTGANNGYSQPIFITSTVGCSNQQSIVFMPSGLMFQSNKGIWLLGRDLSTTYIGAAVEAYNKSVVESALNIPATNYVLFTLDTGQTLMFDYYYSQWGTFEGIPGVSSCIYQNVHTYLNSSGQIYQETPGSYLDGANPVLMSFLTGWLNLAGVQGYQRAYFFYLLGQYYSPHKLYLEVAYDYNPAPQHSVLISPTNYSPVYGGNGSDSETPYGQQGRYGGPSSVENWRVFFKKQRCQSFQLSFQEVFDPTLGVPAGAGLTLSGLNIIVGLKSGFRTIGNANTAGFS